VTSAVAKSQNCCCERKSKILIFSDGAYMRSTGSRAFTARYDHKTMSAGNAQEIADDIADFKANKYSCMLLDSSSFTSGLNLEMTTSSVCTNWKGHVHS
jgi:hypothetical protein